MTPAALGLLLVAATLHATWNYWAKRAGGGGLPFVFLSGLVICAAYVPTVAVYWFLERPGLPWAGAAGRRPIRGTRARRVSICIHLFPCLPRRPGL
jgi:hypothetical protein